MHPAPSVIAFTALSGMGFGLFVWLGLGYPEVTGWTAFACFFLAYALAVGGLLASTMHLGNPQRFLKAFSQWKSSWLSREAWASVAALVVMGLYAIPAIFFDTTVPFLGWLGAILSVVTVYMTSMIYSSLASVPRWNHFMTPVMFLAYSLAGGALLAGFTVAAIPLLLLAGAVQLLTWHFGDGQFSKRGSTIGTATGLGSIGAVRQFEGPHTGTNYLLSEMVYVVARKHARHLRVISIVLMSVLPALLLSLLGSGQPVIWASVVLHVVGVFCARWLFFAEAEHVVGLYYGQR